MDIAAMSTMMAMGKVQAQASIGLMAKVMDTAEQNGQNLIQLMESSTAEMELSVNPDVGGNIDIKI